MHLGKKVVNKHRLMLICLDHDEDWDPHSSCLKCSEQCKHVYIVPDRTKLERIQHKKLVDELKTRQSQGETNLTIRNGATISKSIHSKNQQLPQADASSQSS